jgi:hypothetical protein
VFVTHAVAVFPAFPAVHHWHSAIVTVGGTHGAAHLMPNIAAITFSIYKKISHRRICF